MGLFQFHMPDIGEGIAEAEIAAWHVKPGDAIAEDAALCDVMTDKATVDMTSPVSGVVKATFGEPGGVVAVGSVLVEIEVEGAGNAQSAAPIAAQPDPKPTQPPAPSAAPVAPPSQAQTQASPPAFTTRPEGEAPLAAPATRHRAHELGIPLQYVPGTGPGGRITSEDLEAYIAHGGARPSDRAQTRRTGVTETKIIGLRRKIAEKMQEAKRRIPHFSYVEEFDLTELEALRRDLNDDRTDPAQPKLTLLPFFMRAMAVLQPEFPTLNARYDDVAGVLHSYDGVHIGIATQTPGGLMVPVVRHVEALSVWDCAREVARVTAAARDGTATREELSGSTITLTSLGTLGGIAATPVINAPEVAIIGPNKLVDRPVVRNGQIVIRTLMNLSSSFDHRIVDGHMAASYVQRLKRLIERPALLFVTPFASGERS
ncbi:dihydrolipoamide acetyltransferase family protein [Asticcacaulis sp. 201]|uniref:dihydrolipoamide acetyltransferase family protein n=1 Tax=Asticcacaulis sp. 201 TaxID=3028787 RepID=UPI0029164BCF|nr:dihydrolipoamide acetyltransferase family protein [Asticcacaulis sp. 201]MDV6330337.1 dihydrolipoamide acetyltransferase family protein [Asticcacaulis sp. 201]